MMFATTSNDSKKNTKQSAPCYVLSHCSAELSQSFDVFQFPQGVFALHLFIVLFSSCTLGSVFGSLRFGRISRSLLQLVKGTLYAMYLLIERKYSVHGYGAHVMLCQHALLVLVRWTSRHAPGMRNCPIIVTRGVLDVLATIHGLREIGTVN